MLSSLSILSPVLGIIIKTTSNFWWENKIGNQCKAFNKVNVQYELVIINHFCGNDWVWICSNSYILAMLLRSELNVIDI